MSDQRPDPTDPIRPGSDDPIFPSDDGPATEPDASEPAVAADEHLDEHLDEPSGLADPVIDDTDADAEPLADESLEVDAEPAAPAGAFDEPYEAPAWASTPVQPDPEATAAALAALSAAPERYDEELPADELAQEEYPSEEYAPAYDEPLPEERSSTLVVGGILLGALIIALGILFILFRPFDSGAPIASLSPSPSVSPSISPSPSPFPTPTIEPTAEIVRIGTPDFQGLSLADAETEAEELGLVIRVTDVETDEVEPDTVIDQDPAPGIVLEVGSTVSLSVAVPVSTQAVPDLVGLSAADAAEALEEAGLAGEASEAFDEAVAAGTVLSQEPAPDSELPAGATVAYVVSAGPAPVAVPDLVGLSAADAAEALEEAGLAGEASEAFDDAVAAGTVLSQEPAPDSELPAGATVAYVVSAGPAPVAVPDLVGLSAADAAEALEEAGLAGEASEAFDEAVAAGTVLSQEPAPDSELPAGATVAYVVSAGPAPVAVPDLVGLSAADAAEALEEAGLAGEASEAFDEAVAAGTVLSQEPAPDSELPAGATVAYVVSAGPAPVAVPDLVGLSAADAAEALEEAGLAGEASEAFDEAVAAGTVLSQEPAPDSELPAGATVAYVVSAGPAPVAVPDLVGLSAADAAEALEEAGLAGEASEAFDEAVAAGTVLSQEPAPDSELPAGATVAYVVSAGPAPVAVPDLVGLSAADAAEALEEAGLAGEASEAFDEAVAAGTVLSQEPAPDSELPAGATVAYVVSAGPAPVAVPDLVGLSAADAAEALEEAGLAGEASEAFDEAVAAGTVLSQEPAPDSELPAGATVAYVVSAGPAPVAVPDLVGLSAADAAEALEEAGLAGEASEAFDEAVAAGTVLSQEPAPDSELPAGATVAYVVSAGPAPVAVPDLVGLSAADAAEALEEAGLAGEASEAFDEAVAAGTVLSQEPAPDSELPAGATVAYVVSAGPAPVAVPDLVGLSAADAAEALEEAGLAGEASEAFDEAVAAGTVLSQEPAPDSELPAGATVAYVVSAGPAPVAVPDLVGLSAADAAEALEEAGLAGEASEAFDEAVAAGTVLSQEPAPDSELPAGATVAYVVSAGPAPVAVPDLVGLSAADAAEALEEAGLAGEASEAFDEAVAAGTVLSQEPAPDSELPAGATVAYVVSAGPAPVAVPDLVGLSAADAAEALEEAGLAGEASEAFDEAVAAGTVLSQEPAPDSELPAGATVAYVVSAGPAPVAVPDLVGLSAADAAEALEEAGLAGEASEAFDEAVAAGTVLSQEPAPDSELPAGATVAYVVSAGPAPVAVPDLVGLSAADAAEALEEAGLAGEASEAFDEAVAAGTVLSQEPAPDSELPAGATVAYVVSAGPAPVAVPDLVGLSAADAAEALEEAGLAGEASEAFDEAVAAGTVLSQEPAPDSELPAGATVAYVVSAGPAPVAVPDLVGLSAADAAEALEEAGLAGEASEAFDEAVAAGTVLSQEPAPDSELPAGATVAYVVSAGPAPVAVPDLVGLSAADAAEALEEAGLAGEASEAFDEAVAAGTVLSQEPAPDSELPAGATVAYVVSAGPAPVAVPDLVGLSAADAAEALEEAGLAGEASEAFDEAVAAGTVLSQEPAPDSELPAGATVAYVVSAGPAPVAVPDLVGLSAADAAEALEEAGLAGEASEAFDEAVAAGTVLSQEPAPDSELPAGATVAYVVSAGPAPVAVPDLVGLSAADAAEALEEAGLAGEASEAFDEAVAAGTVLSQEPAPDSELPAGATVAYVVSAGPAPVAVPDLVGLSAADAAEALEEAGLAGEASEAFDEAVAAGTVLSQEPAPDSELPAGATVAYVVSAGPAPVAVPDLLGMDESDASAALEAVALLVGVVTDVVDPAPAGQVLAQEPAPQSEVPAGSAVDLVLSAGPGSVVVPPVRDLPADDAVAALEAAGLVVADIETRAHDGIAAGNALRTEPEAGSEVDPGSAVTLYVSGGPAPVTVPELVGLDRGEARDALATAGLVEGDTSRVEDAAAPDTVLAQEPAPQSEVPAGSAVDLVLSAGPGSVVVPPVRDLPADDAVAALEAAGLVVADIETRAHDGIAAGNALRTEPEAGSEVDPGSAVTLYVSSGPAPVTVPELVGLDRGEARDALATAGLVEGDTSRVEDAAAPDTVLAQEPAPQSEVPAGSAVDLVLSAGPGSVVVPPVRDLPADDAVAALEAAGLVVADIETRAHDGIAAGNALRTEPEAGSEVDPGSAVTLYVSGGPAPVTVPELVGLDRGEARDALATAGLVEGDTSRVEDAAAPDTVLAQEPAPQSEVPAGSAVDLVLSAGPGSVVVPPVRDLPADDAVAALEAAGLVVADIETRAHDGIAAGNALRTEPEAGSEVDPGSAVTLYVSSGPAPVTVPELVGLDRGEARDALATAGLVEGDTSRVEDAAAPDTVLAQEPAPQSEVPAGSAVDLVLSAGPGSVVVPPVRDLPADDAVAALEAAGLVVADIETRAHDGIAAGNALRTEPEAGSEVDPGSAVTLYVSSGPAPVTVPELVGLDRGEARDALATAGLVEGDTSRVEDAAAPDTVLAQEPAPQSEVPAGSAVDLVLSAGPGSVVVPPVRDLPADDAVAALEAAGLVVADIETRAHDGIAAGNALRTEPEAGSEVDPGSAVTLYVSSGPAPVTVPELVGLDRGEARDALATAGLVEGDTSRVEDAAAPDTVLAQEPAPQSEVPAGSAVDLVLSAGPGSVVVPPVRDLPADDAVAALEAAGLVVADIETRAHDGIAAGNALRTEPEAGSEVDPGSAVTLYVSGGPAPVTVPELVGLDEPDAIDALQEAGLEPGERSEASDDTVPAGTIVAQDPAADTEVGQGSAVDYVVAAGPPIASFGEGGTLENDQVAGQLDGVAATIPAIRELDLDGTPYDGASNNQQRAILADRASIAHDIDELQGEERALKRLGLLPSNADLGVLLDQVYGQIVPVAYVEGQGSMSVREQADDLGPPQRAAAAREFGRATTDQAFGIDGIRPGPRETDAAMAAVALEQGDGTAVMLEWIDASLSGNARSNALGQVVPGDDGLFASLPPVIAREYELPYLDGRAFVDALRRDGGWAAVNDAWSAPPTSTEQILHPGRYPDDDPIDVSLDGLDAVLGDGWSEQWQQTMGEARLGVWLADGVAPERSGPTAPPETARSGAATGWGGDRLMSLGGPGDSWAVVWQTEWDSGDDASQFASAAADVLSDLAGAHAVFGADIVGGLSAPVLVVVTSDPDTLADVQTSLGIEG